VARALGLAALVMLPRLASPQFGLLDDGLTLQTGREVHGAWASVLYLIPETGRFFPAYWFVYSAIWSLVGVRPLAFFVVNVLVLAGLIAILARVVRLTGGTPVAAAVAACVFALSGPAIETFYTLSKAEPLQAIWMGLALLATAASAQESRWSWRRAAWVAAATATALLAHATKETTVVLIPIALGWLALEWRARPRNACTVRFAVTFAAVATMAAAAFFVLRWQYAVLSLGEGWYTRAYALNPATIGPAVFRIAAWLLRNFAWLLPVLAAAVALVVRGADAPRRPLLYACVWSLGWLVVYLPWPITFSYHLLPFALGAALLAGTVIGHAWALKHRRAWSVILAAAALWLVGVANAAVDARVQLAVDRANADVVDFLGTLPPRSHVVLNMTPVNEYHFELPMHLEEIKQRADIVFLERDPGGTAAANTFVLTPEMANQPGPTVRIALHEAGVRQDNGTLPSLLRDGGEVVYRAAQRTGIVEIGLQRLLCPLGVGPVFDATYCPRDRGVVFRRTFVYGWQVHRVVRRGANAATMSHGA
jgi:hypothetical protein